MGLAENMAYMGEKKCVRCFFMWKPDGKRTFRTPRCRLEDNIKTDVKGTEWDLSVLGQKQVQGNKSPGSIKRGVFLNS